MHKTYQILTQRQDGQVAGTLPKPKIKPLKINPNTTVRAIDLSGRTA